MLHAAARLRKDLESRLVKGYAYISPTLQQRHLGVLPIRARDIPLSKSLGLDPRVPVSIIPYPLWTVSLRHEIHSHNMFYFQLLKISTRVNFTTGVGLGTSVTSYNQKFENRAFLVSGLMRAVEWTVGHSQLQFANANLLLILNKKFKYLSLSTLHYD